MSALQSYYFDTGIFVTPILKNLDAVAIGRCEDWLGAAALGHVIAVTSYLTWDEVTWVVGRAHGSYDGRAAQVAGERFLALATAGLRFTQVDEDVIRGAQELLSTPGARPRDCLHASSALVYASGRLVTLDSDFRGSGIAARAGLEVILIA